MCDCKCDKKDSRSDLIEWVEKNDGMIPPHLTILMEYGQAINKQKTHILRRIKEGLISHRT